MKIFSGSASKDLAQKIAKHLDSELSPVEIFVFPDGEKRIQIKTKVLEEDTVIIQSTNTPVDENYMELFIMIDALKRSGTKSITVMIPYFGYQRQDHIFRDGEAVSLEVVSEILEKVGMTRLISFDLHSIKIPELFKTPVTHLSALSVFAQRIRKDFNLDEVVLVSPDMGGIRRIKEISQMLGNIPIATVVKDRDLDSGDIQDSTMDGNVKEKIAVMVDDMISTGNTMAEACDLLLKNGAISVYAFATHAVLSEEAKDILQNSKIEKVFVTDTIDVSKQQTIPKLEIISIAEVAAKALKT